MLEIKHLTKHYIGTNKGITDLSLHVNKGDLYAFIGHNGAGKTTTLKAIAGIHDFDEGDILIDGINLKEQPMKCKEKIAYIPDNPDIYEFLTGIQYINFVADIYQIPIKLRKERLEKYSSIFGITDALGELISSYSHGMKQKIVLLAAIIHQPKLLILDEPFVGLDPQAVFELKKIMHEICNSGGSVLFSTHILEVAEKLCNKVAIVKGGNLIQAGKMEDVIKNGVDLESIFMEVAVDVKKN